MRLPLLIAANPKTVEISNLAVSRLKAGLWYLDCADIVDSVIVLAIKGPSKSLEVVLTCKGHKLHLDEGSSCHLYFRNRGTEKALSLFAELIVQ